MKWDPTKWDTPLVLELRQANEKSEPTYLLEGAERKRMRRSWRQKLLKQRGFAHPLTEVWEVRRERLADVVLGLPASGKSSMLVAVLLRQRHALLIDADEAKILIPEYQNGHGAPRVHQESSDVTESLLEQALRGSLNVVIPVVGKNADRITRMAENVALAGYAVNVHLVEIPESEAAQRCVRRLEESGRFVDPAYVLSIGNGPELTYNRIKAEVAIYGYSRWSNDVPHGQLPKNIEISPSDLLSDAG